MNNNTLSDTILENIQQLKKLEKEKGKISRKIGAAKSKSLPIDRLIEESSEISNKIRALKSTIKKENTNFLNLKSRPDNKTTITPPQFSEKLNLAHNSEIHINSMPNMEKWDEYVNSHPNSTCYHQSIFKRIIESAFGHSCIYLTAEDANNEIRGLLPLVQMKSKLFGHYFISLPFFNYGGLLTDNTAIDNILIDTVKNLNKTYKVDHAELRHTFKSNELACRDDKVTMILELPGDIETLWKGLGSKLRSQIKRADSRNIVIKSGSIKLLDDFYLVFSRNMRDIGTPVYSKRFFKEIISNLPQSNFIVIYLDEKPVSASLIIGWKNTIEVPWASTIKSVNKYCINMRLYWEMLKISIEEGYALFDFGRCTSNSNTYRFKKQWGAKKHQLYWHYILNNKSDIPHINPSNPKYKIFINIWKHLPLKVSELIGPYLIKYIP